MRAKRTHGKRSLGSTAGRRCEGLTLIEVILAIVLLGIGLFGVVDLYSQQVRHVKRTRWEAQAQGLAQARLSWLAALGYDGLEGKLPGSGESVVRLSPGDGMPCVQQGFLWNAILKKVDGATPRIEVRVQVVPDAGSRGLVESMGMPLQMARKEAVTYVVK